jgi:ParB-like chromosome segregation protein Spo0J
MEFKTKAAYSQRIYDESTTIPSALLQLHYSKIAPNENNAYSLDGIESLADEIEIAGKVIQNLVVKRLPDDKFKLVSGHRRLAAVKLLVESRKLDRFAFVDCLVYGEEIDDLKLEYILHMSNMSARDSSEYEKMNGLGTMKALRKKMGVKEKGRMSEILGREVGLGSAQTQKYLTVYDRGDPETKEDLRKGIISIEEAYRIVTGHGRERKGSPSGGTSAGTDGLVAPVMKIGNLAGITLDGGEYGEEQATLGHEPVGQDSDRVAKAKRQEKSREPKLSKAADGCGPDKALELLAELKKAIQLGAAPKDLAKMIEIHIEGLESCLQKCRA